VDVCETNDKVLVTASIPGIKPEDIKITVTGDVLQLSGEMKEDNERDEATYHVRERRFGSFNRSIYLPTPVVSDKAEALFENGVLKLTLPKAEEARPKAIKVNLKK
jgi:HSP20 family protein